MPWRCPACRTEITHNPLDRRPAKGEQFRCHVCRLALAFDPGADRLVIAPLETDDQRDRPAKARAKRRKPLAR